jgi:hypothetical protein
MSLPSSKHQVMIIFYIKWRRCCTLTITNRGSYSTVDWYSLKLTHKSKTPSYMSHMLYKYKQAEKKD